MDRGIGPSHGKGAPLAHPVSCPPSAQGPAHDKAGSKHTRGTATIGKLNTFIWQKSIEYVN